MTQRMSFSAPGSGRELRALDAVHTVRIGADDTGGLYELFEIHAPRGTPFLLTGTPGWRRTTCSVAG